MTLLEARAMLARCDPRRLRQDAGISRAVVAAAFGVPRTTVKGWEDEGKVPQTAAGWRWLRFTAALERLEREAAEAEAEAA